ncbi:Alpha/Beta hydrolase protein [Xylariaceae sp. FL0594]|nr:Alpha/Beta hydrolase protein [Xylariaceae sp. FL0594]
MPPTTPPIPSPLTTQLPFLTPAEIAALPYPPDALPGARDVDTFYGTMRVYEWGPEGGRKVLFVHGDATPSPIFSRVARGLVEKGLRVMLFDLWGRGYSDTPLAIRHDVRLFETQILLALASSPLPWTKTGFSLIGFSLGGPIAMAFAGTFPHFVRSVALFAPAGMLNKLPDGYDDAIMHLPPETDEVLKDEIREKVRQILDLEPSPAPSSLLQDGPTIPTVTSTEKTPSSSSPNQDFDMHSILQWQFDQHSGHVHSFHDTVRYGPARGCEAEWRKACSIISSSALISPSSTSSSPICTTSSLHGSQLLVLFGRDDDIVNGAETTAQILEMLPREHLRTVYVPGGHGFPYPEAGRVVEALLEFFGGIDGE